MSTSTPQNSTFAGESHEAKIDIPNTAEATLDDKEDPCTNGGEDSDGENLPQPNHALRDQKYYIRRQGDDLVIAVCEIDEHKIQPVDATIAHNKFQLHARGLFDASCLDLLDPRVITLSHYCGDSFDIPWVLCSRWSWMREIIKLTYRHDEDAKKSVEEGAFTIRRDGTNFLPEHWNTIVRPWSRVKIRLDSQTSDVEPTMDFGTVTQSNERRPGAQAKTESITMPMRYRVDFFYRTEYTREDKFLDSKSWDTPAIIHRSDPSGDFSQVLEEIHHIVFGKESIARKKRDEMSDSALILGPDDKIKPKKLHIRSPLLLNALRSVVKYSSNSPFHNDTEPFVDGIWPFPFKELYHHRGELLDFQQQSDGVRANHTAEENAECDRHIDVLIDYLDHEPTVQLMSAKEQWAQKVPTTTFAGFWLLLKPGADVYIREYGQLNAYVVDLVFGGMNYEFRSIGAENYMVHVWYLVFNGKTIKRKSKIIEVPLFDGERDLLSLPVFPTSFHDQLDGGKLRRKLIDRGNQFFRYVKGPTFLEYSGVGMKQGVKKYNRARVVIEHQSLPWTLPEFRGAGIWNLSNNDNTDEVNEGDSDGFLTPPRPSSPLYRGGLYPGLRATKGPGSRARVPRCECSQCKLIDSRKGTSISPTFSDYDSIDPSQVTGLSEHQALVCMSHMFGFVLKDRTYDILDVNGLTDPIVAENAIDELVMRPEKNKDTIKAIVKTYTDTNGQADLMGVDFIRGKGEGQIFLLHGPPGTGKTLTAESVAEYTKRPLLSITAADLGHDPIEVERNLLRFFKNATSWDAIVLLDEADIYLERRSSKDLRRNSIVSIFLRALDYFEGIIFFTTNRVGQFDEAFMSRIHVAVGYDSLDDKAREQIWETFFRKLKENHRNGGPKIDYDYDAKQYVRKSDDVKSLQWNGREIRNAFQTAVALAIADSKTARQKGRSEVECVPLLTEAHLSQVVHMSAAFKKYIKATHEGMNESDLAFRLGNRYDEHENDNQ